jgi:hypothetical protein
MPEDAQSAKEDYKVTVGDTVKSDKRGKETFQVVQVCAVRRTRACGACACEPPARVRAAGRPVWRRTRCLTPARGREQMLTWGKPKPESVKEFKVPGVFWKAHERDESSKDKTPIYVYYTAREGEKGGDHKFQAASVKKSSKSKHECIILVHADGSARIERLHTGINLNEKVGQVPERSLLLLPAPPRASRPAS